ncbi:MAG: hypothetical protein E7633_02255 [Ruminococcaceae bacterium]|nr:hypothetical protein [Oscillospiraceae bacterium]
MKKRMLCIIIIVVILMPICIFVGQLMIVNYNHIWKYCANYEEYADEFNLVKDYIEAEFPNETNKYLSINSYGGRLKVYDPDTKEYLQFPDDVKSALYVINRNGFPDKDSNFDIIRIHKGRISFGIENGQYALVFSPNNKPKWVNSPDEDNKIRVKSIGDGWYHVTINNW